MNLTATANPPIKAVLFDLDDTLWPIVPVIMHAESTLQAWLAQHAPAVVEQFSIECLRQRGDALIAANPRYQIDLWALRHAVLTAAFADSGEDSAGGDKIEAAMAVFATARNQVTPFDDVLPNLSRWKARLALGSISNGFADLAAIGMAHHFQVSLAAHQFGSAKPDPAIFHAACAALGVAPAQTVYVGDDLLLDVEGAQKAGLRAVWINRKNRTINPALHGHIRPDAICTTLNELDHWLNQAL